MRVGFLLSGAGRTLENLHAYLAANPAVAEIVAVIADRADAFGLTRARQLGIPAYCHPCRTPGDSRAIFDRLDGAGADVALLGGFLRLLEIPAGWERRVLNIHPALIPKYCGRGFHGERVHRAVLEAGESESGCTVHFVDNEYDHGPILLQERVPVVAGDTVETLAARVFEAECRTYPLALRLLAERRVRWEDGNPVIDGGTPAGGGMVRHRGRAAGGSAAKPESRG